ncbi:MAG: GFA family protein [Thiohalocapsa sp.]
MAELTGGCLCGRVRYTLSGEPAFTALCHCKNCQRYTGSAFEAVVVYPSAAVSLQGELKTYHDTGDSGKQVRRRFCPNCGSGVIAEVDIMPGVTIVLAGTLDDASSYTPGMEIYCGSAQPWVHAGGERTRFPKMPPG